MSKRSKPDKGLFNSLAKDFHDLVNNPQALRTALEHFINNIVDESTLGIIFDLHRKYKTNAYDLDIEDNLDEEDNLGQVDNSVDIFGQHNMKKTQACSCLNCDKVVAPHGYSSHLDKCMGICSKDRSCRTRSVVMNSKNKDRSSYSGIVSEDDDVDWNSGDKRRKKKTRNGSKKRTPKKHVDPEQVESLNVDVEGDDDELTNLRDILHLQDHSSSTSPADSGTSGHSGSSRKKEKIKSKKSSKRDRLSPNSSLLID